MEEYFVEIIKHGDPTEIVKRMGPMSKKMAERCDRGVNINLNHAEYYTRIIYKKDNAIIKDV